MNLDDLVIPGEDSPLAQRAAEREHPGAKAVYDRMENCARLLALSFLAYRAGADENLTHRHAFRGELARAEFDHIKITPGDGIATRMITEHDRNLIRRRALAIANATTASQEQHQ
ncbi:hypothetical protein [Streptomyces violaceusniger]|uniref:Uncharacterized protein n=1 Tax=Streptomyces violaceusniger (strain Tu 4113) TaxID=653045 RepID=G2PHW4_STRV4|nr:hypothetical protein [Streptomyces violaceusniger]AEM88915.1 hypothetical protein Strvi_0140 [Streptomyces violaceusniger Tu 4113]